jgi:hypothetical protein
MKQRKQHIARYKFNEPLNKWWGKILETRIVCSGCANGRVEPLKFSGRWMIAAEGINGTEACLQKPSTAEGTPSDGRPGPLTYSNRRS